MGSPKAEDVEAGDIVIWAQVGGGSICPSDSENGSNAKSGHKHIGIAVNRNEAVNNDSAKRMPVKSMIFKGRPVEAIIKPPSKPS